MWRDYRRHAYHLRSSAVPTDPNLKPVRRAYPLLTVAGVRQIFSTSDVSVPGFVGFVRYCVSIVFGKALSLPICFGRGQWFYQVVGRRCQER